MTIITKRLLIFVFAMFLAVPALSEGQVVRDGVIVLHGKGPSQKYIMALAETLRSNGFMVATPTMPYGTLNWDKSYEENLAVVEGEVADLGKRGAKRLFIAGHSLGANFALYAATKISFEGVIAMGPGHVPEVTEFADRIKSDVSKAKAMVAEGKGDTVSVFDDYNQGQRLIRRTTAKIYLSYEDPAGPAVMPRNAAAMKPGTALFWIVGTMDGMSKRGQDYVFNKAAPNLRNKYLVIESDHASAPTAGALEIVKWLKAFDAPPPMPGGPKAGSPKK